ncbi:cryptochrome/photolyase family protein [Chryseobacterium balustinum]|uniref:Deoxyribodipyrimidine photo-lyase n=1 Tax=Chryseobacterium balustinum TaxID=246 RepID=A0ABY1L6K7_9FLAO|nr:deoxyribodipyrimidine photo-lyase [Chryseobacterium balustinum]AZB29064.1 deoxyribodipyrimidine photo-lyase [Chryseobacterium balustinum]SKB59762.1 deoxyribodipyrimidine photo-lyase [Chryseobacterium balustinum]
MSKINIFWFRRDLRLSDNTALNAALQSDQKVLPIFIFDTEILDQLENKSDRRLDYIHQALEKINNELKNHTSGIRTYLGKPIDIFKDIINEFDVETVFCNRDYEPQAINRDKEIYDFLQKNNVEFKGFKDQVIFEKNEIVKSDGLPYTVFTPFSKKWKEKLYQTEINSTKINFENFHQFKAKNIHSLKEIGFKKTDMVFVEPVLDKKIIEDYDKYRDFPALDQTTRLGIALRFGTISVRKCVKYASEHNETWLNELIWREFFMQILYHFPKVVTKCFKEKYENIQWRNNEDKFKLWCEGKTGYPIVDAGMRQLNETGFMHNRVRMVVASFLTKHLLIDWRWGEAYFAEKLLDYELSSNNGNWQWAAGCGCDAAPYFRIFNPSEQTKKFDKDQKYIKKWLPENYSEITPIVEHTFARNRALETYKKAVKE